MLQSIRGIILLVADMIPYIVMILIIIGCIFAEYGHRNDNYIRKCLVIALLPVFILIAFKAETIGTDTWNYLRIFNEVKDSDLDGALSTFSNFETGYILLNYFLGKIWCDSQVILIVVGLFICISLYKFVMRTARLKCLALFFFVTLGFFQFAMSGIRQTIAISIVLWAYPYIRERKLVYFAIIIGLAMMFHKSAIIFAVAYFVANMKLKQKNIFLMFAGIFVLFLMSDKILLSTADVMDYNYGIESTGNGYIFFIIVCIITYLCLRYRSALICQNTSNTILLNINFISLALWAVRLISRTAERVSLYFMPYTYVALEEYLSSSNPNDRKTKIAIAVFLSSVLFFYRISGQPELRNFEFNFVL